MKSKLKVILVILIVLLAAVSILPLPIPVNKTMSGVEFQQSSDEVTEDQVVIKGTYFRYLFRNSVFKGAISIQGRPAGEGKLLEVQLSGEPYRRGKSGALVWYSAEQNKIIPLGEIQVIGNFREVMIWYPYQADEEERFFISSAADYEEAMKMADRLTKGMCGFGEE